MRPFLLIPPALLILSACQPPSAKNPAPAATSEAAGTSQTELPDLTVDERALIDVLRKHIEYLSGKLGERNENAPWELADAADYIAAELEGMGLPVERQGYETQNVAAQNLAVTFLGEERGDQIFIVGVHYDSPPQDRGENAGASATAALLTLAGMMKGARVKRTLRFVFFSMGESPHGDGAARGARHYARFLTDAGERDMETRFGPSPVATQRAEVVGSLQLDRLASFSSKDESSSPLEMTLRVSPGAGATRSLVTEDWDAETFAIHEVAFEGTDGDSDLQAFHEAGVPGVSITGTGGVDAKVDFEDLARFVMQLRRGISRISGEKPTNDGMLTPLSERIR